MQPTLQQSHSLSGHGSLQGSCSRSRIFLKSIGPCLMVRRQIKGLAASNKRCLQSCCVFLSVVHWASAVPNSLHHLQPLKLLRGLVHFAVKEVSSLWPNVQSPDDPGNVVLAACRISAGKLKWLGDVGGLGIVGAETDLPDLLWNLFRDSSKHGVLLDLVVELACAVEDGRFAFG